jgi:membrane protease YdiL (CAAX protease family)
MTRPLRGWVNAHPVAAFILLTFGISYLVGGPVLIAGMAAIAPRDELLRAYLPRILVVYGPGIAALLLARYADAGGPAVLLRRLLPSRADVGVAAAVFLASGVAAAIALRAAGVSPAEMSRTVSAHPGLLVAHFALQVAVVAVGEELGWRGWLLPQLAARTSRLRAALETGVIWGVWHAQLFLGGMPAAIMFLLFVIGLSVLFTWLWAHARSGLFTVVVAHASVNAPLFFWEQVSAGTRGSDERIRHAWFVLQVMYTAAALVLVLARWKWWAATERVAVRRAVSWPARMRTRARSASARCTPCP